MHERRRRPVSSAQPVRGAQRLWHPRVWGTVVGAAGATVFVMVNRGALPEPWPTVALCAWVVALLAYVFLVFGRPRALGEMDEVGPRSGLVYLGSVVGMLVTIRLGYVLLPDSRVEDLRPAVIVIAVGLHFLPFSAAFHTPMFMRLGVMMTALGAAGLGLGWTWDERAAAASAVVTGVLMLVAIAGDAVDPDLAPTSAGTHP
ncbi:MAG: hypothetical protein ABJH68_00410 [Ilumatobacter sp.]|uniref:DUF7010 family protein n=1 Tax=Ilumatobacter sp. TaxID=1967498 RepID=UPI003299AFF4